MCIRDSARGARRAGWQAPDLDRPTAGALAGGPAHRAHVARSRRPRRAGRDAGGREFPQRAGPCLLYTSDAADERSSVDLGGRRIIKKKIQKKKKQTADMVSNHQVSSVSINRTRLSSAQDNKTEQY